MTYLKGASRRGFLHVDDMAAASVYVISLVPERWQASVVSTCSKINVDCGYKQSIREIAEMIAWRR